MSSFLLKIFLIFNIFVCNNCYDILAVFSHEGKSHQWIFAPLIRELSKKGHKVTVIVHYTFGIDADNYEEILLNDPQNMGENKFSLDEWTGRKEYLQLIIANILMEMGLKSCDHMLSNHEVQSLIRSNRKFDLIITELFNNECSLGFAQKFQAPLIGISSTALMSFHTDRLAIPDNPSYIPNNELWHSDRMNFLERIESVFGTFYYKLIHYSYMEATKNLIEKHFTGIKISDMHEMMKNTSLILVNSHFSLNLPRPLVPGVVEIGGIHVGKPNKLPLNIEKFINESTHGVIYFSLGSMIKGHTFPQEKREEFLKAFARLPQRVLWKWENETMPGKPDNVMIQKWMPQFDILSHPNVKAFISHGGLLGTTEAVHCGVPMLVMPQYGDQHTNAKAVEANGGGVILYLQEATEEKVYQKLKTILDPEFKKKAEALSERFRDRPMSPMDTAVYWVEYVARHKGAPHLRTAAVDMPLYQYLLLDVFAFLALVIFVLLYLIYKIASILVRAILPKKKLKQN